MLACIAYCGKDYDQAKKLAAWIEELGGVKNHDCLLTVAKGISTNGVLEPLKRAFKSVSVHIPYDDREGWPFGPNHLWKRTVQHISLGTKGSFKREPCAFLWIEPDCVPLKSTWMDDWEAAYLSGKRPFMGGLVTTVEGRQKLTGIAIYPFNVMHYAEGFVKLNDIPFDVMFSKSFSANAQDTKLLHGIYNVGDKPPTFPDSDSLKILNADAVLFHRCKDGTLIDRLRTAGRVSGLNVRENDKSQDGGKNGQSIPSSAPTEGSTPSTAPLTISDQIRLHIEGLEKVIDGKTGRSIMVVNELRKRKLIPQAKKRS